MTAKIDVINAMLATTGTAPLSSSDVRHPLYATANAIFEDALEEFCSKELWFNTHVRTLRPDVESGKIIVPGDTLSAQSCDGSMRVSVRGNILFNDSAYTDTFDGEVECVIIRKTPVEEMPPAAVQYLRAICRYQYFLDRDGDTKKLVSYGEIVQRKELELATQNTKQFGANFFNSPGAQNFYTRRYPNNTNGLGGIAKVR